MVLLEDGESRFILLKRWTEPSASPDFPVWTIPNSPKSQVTSEEEGVAISCSRGSSRPGDWALVSCIPCPGRQILYRWCHLGSPNKEGRVELEDYHFSNPWQIMITTMIPEGLLYKHTTPMMCSCQTKNKPKSEQVSTSGFNYQIIGITGTAETVKWCHEEVISKIQGMENSIGQATNFFNK